MYKITNLIYNVLNYKFLILVFLLSVCGTAVYKTKNAIKPPPLPRESPTYNSIHAQTSKLTKYNYYKSLLNGYVIIPKNDELSHTELEKTTLDVCKAINNYNGSMSKNTLHALEYKTEFVKILRNPSHFDIVIQTALPYDCDQFLVKYLELKKN
jgi:hypothetical protein